MIDPTAFDAFADDYDDDFTDSRLGRLLRDRAQQVFAKHFHAGDHVLELTCGTGEDAVWLAKRGVTVTATDGSAGMTAVTAEKAARANLSQQIHTAQRSLQQIADQQQVADQPGGVGKRPFDAVFSNFGGLNVVDDWRPLAAALAKMTRPGAPVVLVVMGPYCPWEFGWHLLHGEWETAVRRFRKSAPATIGDTVIPIWYPTARRLRRDFAPWFRHVQTESLGLWLPPSYLSHLVDKWPALFAKLNQFEQKTARLTGGWGDHYIVTLLRR